MTPTHPESELVALLPCPWCGCKPELFRGRNSSYVACNTRRCKVQPVGLRAHPFPKAVSAWNSLTTRAATVPQGVLDSARLDALEMEIAEGGPIVLHNGEGTGGKHRGLGMANTGRTLRQAIDELCDLPTPPPAELGKGS